MVLRTVSFKVLTVGWEPEFIEYLLTPVLANTTIEAVHGLVGDSSRLAHVAKKFPHLRCIALSKAGNQSLPPPDYQLLARLEAVGVPTIKSMVQGDPYLRNRSESESFGYATLLACSLRHALEQVRPDLVLSSFDCLHSGISLAVSKAHSIPWVAMAFPVIPDRLTGFSRGLTPNSLVPLTRAVDHEIRKQAAATAQMVRAGEQRVMAYRAPNSLRTWTSQYFRHTLNLFQRATDGKARGVDRFRAPTIAERCADISRRTVNNLLLPTRDMLLSPPRGRFVYYPFHMSPESMLDTWAPFYQDQIAFIKQLSQAIPADTEFVVKLHFSDPYNYRRSELRELINQPRMRVASPFAPSQPFIEQASLVIGITGTSNIEAALRGKPVLLFADSPYVHFPRSERALRPDQLHQQIARMLGRTAPSDDETVEAFAAYIARYMPGRINDWGRPITSEEVGRLSECFRALTDYISIPENRQNWYKNPPFIAERV